MPSSRTRVRLTDFERVFYRSPCACIPENIYLPGAPGVGTERAGQRTAEYCVDTPNTPPLRGGKRVARSTLGWVVEGCLTPIAQWETLSQSRAGSLYISRVLSELGPDGRSTKFAQGSHNMIGRVVGLIISTKGNLALSRETAFAFIGSWFSLFHCCCHI